MDAGGADLAPRGSVTSSSSGRPSMSPPTTAHAPRAQYYKRYSHDSGLSEDTYVKTHKSHRLERLSEYDRVRYFICVYKALFTSRENKKIRLCALSP